MDIPSKNKPAAGRYALLDELRGLDLLSMIGYHACWDLIFLFGMSAAWYTGWQGHLWQQSICWVFILLSGFCLPLGHRPLRRGLIVSGAGPHGAAAPVGLCAAGLAGPTLAGDLSAASAGDLWGIAASVPCF